MNLGRFPRVDLTSKPTPLHRLKRLEKQLGLSALHIKRDDLTDLATGGNKTRKLEYLLGDALEQGITTVVTEGRVHSNHCRQTAAACSVLGLECVLVMNGREPAAYEGNLLLDRLFGARVVFIGSEDKNLRGEVVAQVVDKERTSGKKVLVVAGGGSDATGALGYFDAAIELLQQDCENAANIDHAVIAGAGGGTAAGIVAATSLLGNPFVLHVISVQRPASEVRLSITNIATAVQAKLGIEPVHDRIDSSFVVHDKYVGEGYAHPTTEGTQAISTLAQSEGILLDPIYTAKAFAGLLGLLQNRTIPNESGVAFWHTGGTTQLLASHSQFDSTIRSGL